MCDSERGVFIGVWVLSFYTSVVSWLYQRGLNSMSRTSTLSLPQHICWRYSCLSIHTFCMSWHSSCLYKSDLYIQHPSSNIAVTPATMRHTRNLKSTMRIAGHVQRPNRPAVRRSSSAAKSATALELPPNANASLENIPDTATSDQRGKTFSSAI